MKTSLCTLFLIFGLTSLIMAETDRFQLLDMQSREAISQAHIMNEAGRVLTVTDQDGYFERADLSSASMIIIHALGYKEAQFSVNDLPQKIYLAPEILELTNQLIVEAESGSKPTIHAYHSDAAHASMDEFLSSVDGISTVQRGAFAWEPSVRGQTDQRLTLTIDGMPVFKACVDKMDPITSYVELNNLSSLKVDKNGAAVAQHGNGNTSVNLLTKKPEFSPFSLQLETAGQWPNNFQNHRFNLSTSDATQRHAFRVSGSYRASDNLRAGNYITIQNTQYEKLNLNVQYKHLLPSGHSIEASYLTDKAYDVGYPALLMDATSALTDIGRIQWNLTSTEKPVNIDHVMLYANMIRHSMDDYDRDVANRTVMRGMYMPMYGETFTYGAKLQGGIQFSGIESNWFLEAFNSDAFGDMLMESLDPSIEDMLIYNLKDVRTQRVSLGLKQQMMLNSNLHLTLEENLRLERVFTKNEAYASFFEGLHARSVTQTPELLPSFSASLLWMITEQISVTPTVVYSERIGNHMEQYGHYVYNYVDGFFYDGNPFLDREKTINAEINTIWKKGEHSLSASVFTKFFQNYIDGFVSDDLSNADFQFKQYANVGDAVMAGGEVRAIVSITEALTFEHRMAYVYAHNQTLDEPLPLIPPLNGTNELTFTAGKSTFAARVQWASDQQRIARISSIEDATDSYAVFGLKASRSWLQNQLQSTLALNNITDRFYNEHTSLGNIPQHGFNVMLTLSYSFGNR